MPDTEAMKALLAIEEAILATMPRSPWADEHITFKVQDDRVGRLRALVEGAEHDCIAIPRLSGDQGVK